jgi:hypothetical protein
MRLRLRARAKVLLGKCRASNFARKHIKADTMHIYFLEPL